MRTLFTYIVLGSSLLIPLTGSAQAFPVRGDYPSAEPCFSHPGGFYAAPFNLSLTVDTLGTVIFYTLDGSNPDESSLLYTNPLFIGATTVVRAAAYHAEGLSGRTITHTYFLDVDHSLPVISLSTDPANLWDEETGIYAMGRFASPEFPHFGANFWEDWERPIHLEFFETGGPADLSLDAGVKIFGGWSRGYPQKSLAIYARSKYGYAKIVYPLFPEKPFDEFEAIVLRNSGNDWESTLLRDGFMATLACRAGLKVQAYRPVVVYFNGEFWGIHNLREKINEHFIASNHDVDPDNIDFLENQGAVIRGDSGHYMAMMAYINTHDLSRDEHFEAVGTMMDVENFILYELTQIFIDNTDWPGNNLKYWRPKTPDGKWKWIMFDTDFGFGIWNPSAYIFNTLEFAAEPNGPAWPNPPWSTLLFRKLLENETFRTTFIRTFCDHLNTTFQAEQTIALLRQFRDAIAPEIPHHQERWDRPFNWEANVEVMENFASNRVGYVRSHLQSFFALNGMGLLHIDVSPEGGGTVHLNSIDVPEIPWKGYYFNGLPVTVAAHPAPGYRFAHWSGADHPDSSVLTFLVNGSMSIAAFFEPGETQQQTLVINEINYNSSSTHDPEDWIEFYNAGPSTVVLDGWMCKDDENDHIFTFPARTSIESGQFLVLCRDTAAFQIHFPEVNTCIGDLDFGLSGGGDCVRLFDGDGALIDSVIYDDTDPWPSGADGNGPTLELINPDLDNTLPESWAASIPYGTPGFTNSAFGCYGTGNGDVDQNDQVNILDVVFIVQTILGEREPTLDQFCRADMNRDEEITVLDVIEVVMIILGGNE